MSTLSTLVDSTLDRAAGLEGFNPDELLEKLSVSEVKGVQQKLRYVVNLLRRCYEIQNAMKCRHNAEAKQQELRLMVGCVCVCYTLVLSKLCNESVGNATAICCRPLPRLRPWQNPLSVC